MTNIPAQMNQIVAAFSQARYDEAIALIEPLLAVIGTEAALHNIAGAACAGAGRLDEAVAHYDRAIALQPACADALSNRGIALREQGRLDDALQSYDLAIRHQPHFPSALYNRGNLLQQMRRFDEALGSFAQAIAQKPDYVEAYINSGNILQESGRLPEAVEQFGQAIALRPDLATAYVNRGNALHELKRLDAAVADYRRAIILDPHSDGVRARLSFLKAHMCDWSEETDPIDVATLGIHGDAVTPFNMLSLDDDPARNLRRSVKWAEEHYPARVRVAADAPRRPERLRIGYFSADFQSHATMWLMSSLFEAHDRERFEIHAFSYGPNSHDVMRQRVIDTSDAFHDVRMLGDAAVAELSRSLAIDIAIDLKGYTQNSRPGIFAHGAAPIQMSYLGYPGSSGADFFDYAIADPVVVPAEKRAFYSEKILAMPHSYQVNDDRRPIATDIATREALGLPGDGFVFCCFNNSFKITPDAFGCWMRLLGQVEGSVLWLLRDNDWAKANLRAEAERRGIAGSRIVFADRMPMPSHLARHVHADLFLDSFAYNAHTTASDALWAGVPVVTKLGEGFAARVGASLLRAIGLPELITETIEAYERLALDLAKSPERIRALKAKIAAGRLASPLFDTPRFVRDLERGYDLAFDRLVHGLDPDHIDVPAVAESGTIGRIAA